MGNHEYCDECGESDFHYGRPCDPAKKAAHQAEQAANQKRADQETKRITQLLDSVGLKYDLTRYGIIVRPWE